MTDPTSTACEHRRAPHVSHVAHTRWRAALSLCLVLVVAACATVPAQERLLSPQPNNQLTVRSEPCTPQRSAHIGPLPAQAAALDGGTLRILSWNLHKGEDDGWDTDLARFADQYDLLLLQEAVLLAPLRRLLDESGHGWQMAGAFSYGERESGVMTASRVPAFDACTTRNFEPLFPIPKSALITRYALRGTAATLAVANLHGVNFSLGLGRFREQLEGVAAELARHSGPVVLGGDFNTWSLARHAVLGEIAARLGLQAVPLVEDGRMRVFGHHLDHLFVRGFTVLQARAPEVTSSDHNPILVTLSLR
jgi:endonuclease/exonuclease/phosphatase (EEP) superfamily protein YafD